MLLGCNGGWAGPARADSDTAVAAARRPRYALGASAGFLRQTDFGGVSTTRFVPALVGLAYVNVAPRLYLRPGVRLGITGITQPAAASDARIEEHGVQGRAELGVLYDAWVIPVIAVGTGLERRSIDFATAGNVQDSGLADRTEWLGLLYAQAGLGCRCCAVSSCSSPTSVSSTRSRTIGPRPSSASTSRSRSERAPQAAAIILLAVAGSRLHSSSARSTSGTTIVASDSMTYIGVSSVSLSQVIFSSGVAPEYDP